MENGFVQRKTSTYSGRHKEKRMQKHLIASSRIWNHDSESVRATYASKTNSLKKKKKKHS